METQLQEVPDDDAGPPIDEVPEGDVPLATLHALIHALQPRSDLKEFANAKPASLGCYPRESTGLAGKVQGRSKGKGKRQRQTKDRRI